MMNKYDYGEWDMVTNGRPRQCPECKSFDLSTDGETDDDNTHIETMFCYSCEQFFRFTYWHDGKNINKDTGFYDHLPLMHVTKHDEDQYNESEDA